MAASLPLFPWAAAAKTWGTPVGDASAGRGESALGRRQPEGRRRLQRGKQLDSTGFRECQCLHPRSRKVRGSAL